MTTEILLVPPHLLECPPSVRDGTLTLEEEREQRIYGCGWIQRGSIIVRVPPEAMSNSHSIFHRFYYRRSMKEFDVKFVAAASLYLGCKLAETPRRIRDIVNLFVFLDWLEEKNDKLQNMSTSSKTEDKIKATSALIQQLETTLHLPSRDTKEFTRLKTNIHRVERHILRETGFMITQTLVHPHRFILQYIHSMLGVTPEKWRLLVSQKAWGYLNDALRLPLCCSFQPAVLTVTSIYLAAKDHGLELPYESNWFEIFDVSWEQIVEVSAAILSLYKSLPPKYRSLANPPVPPPLTETPNSLHESRCSPPAINPSVEEASSETEPLPLISTNVKVSTIEISNSSQFLNEHNTTIEHNADTIR